MFGQSRKDSVAEFKFVHNTSSQYATFSSEDENDNGLNAAGNFYSPLCKSGYLTPLQRKKLREKRKIDVAEEYMPSVIKSSKLIGKKRFKGLKVGSNKSQKSSSKKKVRIPLNELKNNSVIRLAVSQLIPKKSEMYLKEKKFFRCLSPERLAKVNFTMPLVSKKGLRLNFRNQHENLCSKQLNKGSSVNKSADNTFSESCKKEVTKETSDGTKSVCVPNLVKCFADSQNSLRPKKALSSDKNTNFENKLNEIQNENSQSIGDSSIEQEILNENLFDFDWPSDKVLLERQKRARAICRKLSILKKFKLKVQNFNENSDVNVPSKQVFYPLFDTAKSNKKDKTKRIEPKKPQNHKKVSSKGGEQMIIDAGQTEIGAKICETCSMVYCIGQEEDEKLHTEYHNKYIVNLKFLGWKNENVVAEYCDGRVIMIRKEDKSFMLKKVEDVLEIANRDLGFPKTGFPTKPDVVFLLFVSNEKKVVGCLVAESISSAYQVVLLESSSDMANEQSNRPREKVWRIGNWYSSSKPNPAICGVNRIWVASEFRRRKVASRLVDCIRCHFIYGHIVGIRELAFTDPSPDGREFAAAYTGTDNFLVYR